MKQGLLVILLAVTLFSAPLGLAQDQPDALRIYRLGRDLEAVGRLADAEARYSEAIKICLAEIERNANNMDSYTVLTWALLRQKEYRETVDWGKKALAINPRDYRIIESMGEAFFYLDDYQSSLQYMQQYVEAVPQGDRASVAYFFMGEIYRLQRRPQHADIAYTTALHLEAGNALWWYRTGLAREMAASWQSAFSAFERALKLNPQYKEAAEALERVRKQLS